MNETRWSRITIQRSGRNVVPHHIMLNTWLSQAFIPRGRYIGYHISWRGRLLLKHASTMMVATLLCVDHNFSGIEILSTHLCHLNQVNSMTISWCHCHGIVSVTLHYITLHYITLHYITLHYITLHYITLHYITLHYITLHYITLHYITLHYITLHYITLHYITMSKTPTLYIIL